VKLYAISDLHLSYRANREALAELSAHPDDWLIVAGDTGERPEHLALALDLLAPRFARLIWTPGNHDLWTSPLDPTQTAGERRYDELVALCQSRGVLTPEDPYPTWPDEPDTVIAPLFLLFDYSYRPADVTREAALAWALDAGIVSVDERRLHPTPWPSREAWCAERCAQTEARLAALPGGRRTILVSHWPLRYDLARPPRVPRYSLWCGTTRTEDWHRRFNARVVISGHLHFRTTLFRHGVRFDEVSLGYPRDWKRERGIDWYLRQVLPTNGPNDARFVPARDPFR
jgi:hypothetical protein